MGILTSKRVVLGVGGGIAAYKTPELVRRMKDAGADVRVVLTDAAAHFVSALSLEIVSEHPVGTSLWDTAGGPGDASRINHTELVRDADLVVLAPATANLIGRIRHGLADDLLTTALMAARTPVLICPAMNTEMFENPIVADNLAALLALPRYHAVPPETGLLACGIVGQGRLPDPPQIIAAMAAVLAPKPLLGQRIAVSAGPTREAIDPVRYIENHSTGTMGFQLARALVELGATVTLIAGPVSLATPVGVAERIDIVSANDLFEAVQRLWPRIDGLVMAAAVADYRPEFVATQKKKKREDGGLAPLTLVPTVDILRHFAAVPDAARVVRVGFAAETTDLLTYARRKRVEKDLDWIVANDVSTPGVGFGPGDNAGWLLGRDGAETPLPRLPKADFADDLAARLAAGWPRPGVTR